MIKKKNKIMSYLTHLKKNKMHYSCRWIVKYNEETGLVREVKLIHNPEEYRKRNQERYGAKCRSLHTQNGLIKILENDRAKRREQ